ncbi:MAG TPA: hypothetical protein VF412_01415 [Bdellovibrio sp.]|uniref:hypothetical protein n=1 Tax=Bdellovibrio sp. TaxID=28201 RepID=UPI002EFCCE9B
MMLKIGMFTSALLLVLSTSAFALPNCLDNRGGVLDVNNDQVLQWKADGKLQYHSRGHIKGTFVRSYPEYTGHAHFEVQIGNDNSDTIEIVYNQSFGELPDMQPGQDIEVCGDYITTGYQGHGSSPDGAILHWVHQNNSGHGHPSGYVAVDGTLYGDGNGYGN